jgi:nucleotide-binding universal stress UspA family protein
VHRRQLDEALAILAEAGVQAEPIPAIGNPAAEIISAAESRHVDLIVIGRQV